MYELKYKLQKALMSLHTEKAEFYFNGPYLELESHNIHSLY